MADTTTCCVVGGGPAGAVLSLLLARRGIRTTLLEAHPDFDREFRGDTVHPSTLEMLDDLGLADPLLAVEHGEMRTMSLRAGDRAVVVADFSRQRTKFPFIAMIPQAEFLTFIVDEAKRYPSFDLRLGARATDLIVDGDVCGVQYRDATGAHALRATLTVAADGRASRLRERAGWKPVGNAPPMDVMWTVVPRRAGESTAGVTGFRVGRGRLVVVLARAEAWQLAYVLLKGTRQAVRDAGLDGLRREVAQLVPELADRTDAIRDWNDVRFLSVESSRIETWHRPGLLAIGDAAHVMSPVGGVGINYAIQDAVAAANILGDPLREGSLSDADLAQVQRRREWPTVVIQRIQRVIQQRIVARALDDRPFELPIPARIASAVPFLRDLPARVIGWGPRPERVV